MSEAPFQAEQGGDLFPELNEARATITRLNDTRALGLRVEALRAASQAVAPLWAELAKEALANGTAADVVPEIGPTVLATAEQFAKWLETGE